MAPYRDGALKHNDFFLTPILLLTISALLYVGSFVFPFTCAGGVFLFLIPLFYLGFNNQLRAVHGFYWGVMVYSVHLSAFFFIIYQQLNDTVGRCAGPLIMLSYVVIYVIGWFWILKKVAQKIPSIELKVIASSVITAGYFWFMYAGVFWFFGSWLGYCFCHPLLPLAVHSPWLAYMPRIGLWGLTGCLIGWQAALVGWLIKRRWHLLVAAGMMMAIFWCGWFGEKKMISFPRWLSYVGYLSSAYATTTNPLQVAAEINLSIEKLRRRCPQLRAIIMPESSFPFALNECPQSLALWAQNGLKGEVHFFIGGNRQGKEGDLYNCLFHIYQGRIIQHYDKKFPMIFTEYIPYNNSFLNKLSLRFWPQKKPFKPGLSDPILFVGDDMICIPQICADLFLGQLSDIDNSIDVAVPILCIANDRWFCATPYMATLMRLYAQLIIILTRRTMLYVAHTGMWWIDENGSKKLS